MTFLGRSRFRDRLRSQGGSVVFPLDSLPSPVLAYSTRRLRTAYSGALAEWRRASDSAVTDVSGDPAASYSITSSSPVAAGGALAAWISGTDAFYRTWYNQGTLASGDQRQATLAAQFRGANTGTIDLLNARAAMRETAVTQMMASLSTFSQAQIANATSFTIGVVLVSAESTQSAPVIWGSVTFGANIINLLDEWSDGSAYLVAGDWTTAQLAYAQASSNVARTSVVRRAVNAMTWRRDGVLAASGTASGSFTATQTVRIGDGTRALGTGRIAELVWWADALSDTDRATYEADAKAWFGTP